MKKRLRKKKYLGEFTEWGAPINTKLRSKDKIDYFLNDFIEKCIERNGCLFGGGAREYGLEGVIEMGKTFDKSEEKLTKITCWLETQNEIESYVIGDLVDLWKSSSELWTS